MKHTLTSQSLLLTAVLCLTLCAPTVRAGTESIIFGFQKGNLTTNGVAFGSGSGYSGVVDGTLTDSSATFALTTGATSTIGNQNRNGSPNGQTLCGAFSYDLTEMNDFIAANTGPNSSVTIQSVSFQLVSGGNNANGAGTATIRLYATDAFTSGATWSTTNGTGAWSTPFQNIGSSAQYGYTGGPSPLGSNLGGTSPNTAVTSGNPLTWTSSAGFITAVQNALARADKKLYLTANVAITAYANGGDQRLSVNYSPTATAANRPKLLITLNVTTTAGSSTWTGGTDTTWTTPGNWLSGSVPATDALIVFDNNSTANLGTVLNQNFSVTSISVTNPTGPVSIGGANNLTNGAGGIDLSAATQNLTITAPLVLGAGQTWNVVANRNLIVSGGVSGSAALTVSGAGKVALGGAATHTGDTTVSAGGTLQMGAANVLPNLAGGGNVNVNGVLDLNANAEAVNGLAGSGVVDNTAAGSATLTVGSNNTNSTFSGTLKNTGGPLALVKTGNGTLTLSSSNSYIGGTTINAGNLLPGNTNAIGTGTLTVNSGGIFYPVASLTFTNAVTLNGGTLEVGGANNNVLRLSGPVTVTADSTIVTDGGAYGISLAGGVDMGSGDHALKSFNSNSGKGSTISGQITGANGTIMNIAPNGTLWITGSNTFAGTFRATNSGSLSFQNMYALQNATLDMNAADIGSVGFTTNIIIGALTGSRNLNLGPFAVSVGNNNASTIYSGALTNTGSLTKIGTGTLTLSGNNTYTGVTTIGAGMLALSGSGSISNSPTINVHGGAQFVVTNVTGGFTLVAGQTLKGNGTVVGEVNVAAGGILAAGASIGTLTISGAVTNNGTILAEITNGPSADKIVFGGSVHNLGGTLTVTSLGTLLNGTTYDLFDFNGGAPTGVPFAATNLPGGLSHWNTTDLLAGGTITFTNTTPVAASFTNGVASHGSTTIEVVGKFATDADSFDALTITSVSSANASIVGGTIVYTNASGANDSFTYTVSDGLASATGTVMVQTYSPQGFNKLSGPTSIGSGQYSVSFLGIPNEKYALDEASTLAPPDWTPKLTNTASGTGSLEFIFTPVNPSGFFRTRHVP